MLKLHYRAMGSNLSEVGVRRIPSLSEVTKTLTGQCCEFSVFCALLDSSQRKRTCHASFRVPEINVLKAAHIRPSFML